MGIYAIQRVVPWKVIYGRDFNDRTD